MTIFRQNVGISLVIVIGGISTASAQSATVKLEMLVETSARRLTLAKQVAFAKWDARSQVEDMAREAEVITAAVKASQSRGLDRDFVSNFFKAQIEANKLVQYSLLASWHRAGSAPFHPAINLTSVRARLDRLQEDLIVELADTAALRAGTACQADTARAVGKYIAIHKLDDPLVAMAKVAADKNRWRFANQSRNFDVFHRWESMETGESPWSVAMKATKSSSSSAKRPRGGVGIFNFPWKRNHFFATKMK